MQGKIIKGIAGFYYVHVPGFGLYECKAKGLFRKEQNKPLIGDDVMIVVLDEEKKLGNIQVLLPRNNELLRPAVANVDQALIVFSVVKPLPNLNLLDRFLIMMELEQIPCGICFTKTDLASEDEIKQLKEIYEPAGIELYFCSVFEKSGLEELQAYLHGKTTVLAGPSGVGKSTLINEIQGEVQMETGEISEKIGRGKHTTRHSQLIHQKDNTYFMDTPGFTSLQPPEIDKIHLGSLFKEFAPLERNCRFQGCAHIHEPDCAVKEAVLTGSIHASRYESYCHIYKELNEKRRYGNRT